MTLNYSEIPQYKFYEDDANATKMMDFAVSSSTADSGTYALLAVNVEKISIQKHYLNRMVKLWRGVSINMDTL